jgi:hypothetical protein
MINCARCTRKIKSMVFMAKAAFNRKFLFTSKLYLILRNKLVNSYVWSIGLYGAEILKLMESRSETSGKF